MAQNEKAAALVERAERLGLHVTYDSGFLVATRPFAQRDDVEGMVRESIVDLGECLKDVVHIAVGRSRGVHGSDFLGQQVFIPGEQIVGTLEACSEDGTVQVSYPSPNERRSDSRLNFTGPGDRMLVIVAGEKNPADRSSIVSGSIRDERLRGFVERAEHAGIRLALEGGFTVVKWSTSGAEESAEDERAAGEAIIRDIGGSRRLPDIVEHLAARARGVRGKDFIGQQAFVPDFGEFAVIESCDADGSLDVTYRDERMGSLFRCAVGGDRVLVITGEVGTESIASLPGQKPDAKWRNLLRRAFLG
jgi:hypothetical protein